VKPAPNPPITVDLPAGIAAWRDPAIRAAALLVLGCVAGFLAMGLAWRGAARTFSVPVQIPWVVSGGIGGLAMIGASLGFLTVHAERRRAAVRRARLEGILQDASEVVNAHLRVWG
jgi:hypothetical protein